MKEKEKLDESQTENISSKRAVALKYQRERQNAPQVVAKGSGYIAEQILAAARQHSVPIYQNRLLADMLMMVDLDREIPPEMYKAVAEVLAYVYRIDRMMGGRRD